VLLCKIVPEIQSVQVLGEVLHFEQGEAQAVQTLGVVDVFPKNPLGHYAIHYPLCKNYPDKQLVQLVPVY
jgi:hypothetical protein